MPNRSLMDWRSDRRPNTLDIQPGAGVIMFGRVAGQQTLDFRKSGHKRNAKEQPAHLHAVIP
jgi:hypothetical protein